MENKKIQLITSSREKKLIALHVMEFYKPEIELEIITGVQIDEIQSFSDVDIIYNKEEQVKKFCRSPFIVSKLGLYIPRLNNFPGTYSKQVGKMLSSKHILQLLEGEKDRTAFFTETLGYFDGSDRVIFSATTMGSISEEVRGDSRNPFDNIFVLEGDTNTLASYTEAERIKKYNSTHWKELFEYVK